MNRFTRETWRPIAKFNGFYEVSDMGRLRRIARLTRDGRWWRKKILSLKAKKTHYMRTIVMLYGATHDIVAHVAVLEAFVGPRPAGLYACHNNGDKHDNRLANLRWDTQAANLADRIRHGTDNGGERHYRAHFTNDEAQLIRGLPGSIGAIALAKKVSKTCIQKIREGKTYRAFAAEHGVQRRKKERKAA